MPSACGAAQLLGAGLALVSTLQPRASKWHLCQATRSEQQLLHGLTTAEMLVITTHVCMFQSRHQCNETCFEGENAVIL